MLFLRFFVAIGLICSSFAQDEEPDTTTPTTTTSTSTTTTTTPATTTTTEAPVKYSYYNITNPETGVTCIMLDGNMKFKVEYNLADKTNTTMVEVPKPSSDVEVRGSCEVKNGSQFISIAWGADHHCNVTFNFTESKDHQTWTVGNVIAMLYIDAETFPNATDVGSTLTSNITLEMRPAEVPVNHSYKCFSNAELSNFTTTVDGAPYNLTVSLQISGVQLQAFNMHKTDKFADEVHCDADKVADIVPIAVGCALAGLIIIVLIAYIVGRRRRSASYQSV